MQGAERLRGFRLKAGRCVPIALVEGRMHSEQMGLDLVVDGEFMRLFDPMTSRFLPTLTEAEAERQEETMRADAAEAEVAQLRAELAALRGR